MSDQSTRPRKRTTLPIEISVSAGAQSDTPWEEARPAPLGWASLVVIGVMAAVIVTSLLSPINFTMMLGKALRDKNHTLLEKIVNTQTLSRCIGEEENPLTASDLVRIYQLQPESRPSLKHWHYGWGNFPDVRIIGLSYPSIIEAEVKLSDGMILALERTGIWSWELFCVRH